MAVNGVDWPGTPEQQRYIRALEARVKHLEKLLRQAIALGKKYNVQR